MANVKFSIKLKNGDTKTIEVKNASDTLAAAQQAREQIAASTEFKPEDVQQVTAEIDGQKAAAEPPAKPEGADANEQ